MREQLKQKTKDEIFLHKFNEQVNSELQKVMAGSKYSEKVNPFDYLKNPSIRSLRRFTIEGDDADNSKKWHSFMVDCAHYYDRPTLDQEHQMKRDLQYKYDDLFANGIFPRLQSRKDLLTWACHSWEDAKRSKVPEEEREAINDRCEQYGRLLSTYGPNYAPLKAKLGYVRGLFDDRD